jgi:TetR/AcrR family transcriptional repressor of mexJK operon
MDKASHIVQSAQPLFAQFGLRKVTTDDIARKAHVSKATVYKYFKNKSDIFDRVIEDEAADLLTAMETAVAGHDSAVDKLRAHLTVHLQKVREFANFFRVTQDSWADYWPHVARIRRAFLNREQELVAKILRGGVKSGELKVRNTQHAALALILSISSVEFQWHLDEGLISLPKLIDLMIEMMVEGLGAKR